MAAAIGLGGVFFRARDPQAAWAACASTRTHRPGFTPWPPFAHGIGYFGDETQSFMLHSRVDELDLLLARQRAAGVGVNERREDGEVGRFGWIGDVEGRRAELWQPPG